MLKKIKKCLSLLLVFCMIFSMTSMGVFATELESTSESDESINDDTVIDDDSNLKKDDNEVIESEDTIASQNDQIDAQTLDTVSVEATNSARNTDNDEFYRIVHVDAGRKYFSPENIKSIIDIAASAGYNQVELYLSDNQGFRLALDNMKITTSTGNTYDLTASLGDGYSDGSKNPDYSGQYLTQSEMTDIIGYAKSKSIDIVPCINTPGHMGAILEEFHDFCYSGSNSSIDLENTEAVAFALAIVEAYVTYFESQGIEFFNIGADEYANDLSTMGFAGLYNSGKYQNFVDYLNNAAQIVINHGMIPRAFNDGIYYNNDTNVDINEAIQVCYWSSGWSGYDVASASTIAAKGHDMINTHGDYYWILGGNKCTVSQASQFDYQTFSGSTVNNPAGAMFCIWCDVANVDGTDGGTKVVADTEDVIKAFGAKLPGADSASDKTVSNESKKVTITAPGLTGVSASEVTPPSIENTKESVAYDIVPVTSSGNYVGSATVTIDVPDEWATEKIYGYVVNSDDSITKGIEGEYADGFFTFVVPHFSTVGAYIETQDNDTGDTDVVDGASHTISVNGTVEEAQNGLSDQLTENDIKITDESIVKVELTSTENSTEAESKLVLNERSEIVTGRFVIVSENNAFNALGTNGTSITNVSLASTDTGTEISENVVWDINAVSGGYTISQNINGTTYYLALTGTLARSQSLTLTSSQNKYVWTYNNSTFRQSVNSRWGTTYTYYLNFSNNSWNGDKKNKSDVILYNTKTETTTASTTYDHTITFTGLKEGTTDVIVGNVKYTIIVTAENLENAAPLVVEFWITNRPVTPDGINSSSETNGKTVTRIYYEYSVQNNGVYSDSGIAFDELVPKKGTQDNKEVVLWKGTRLSGSNKQTVESGVDKTKAGTDFTYVRYWGGVWAYSSDGDNWTNIEEDDQIVAYYFQKTEVTTEITTNVVDWGQDYAEWKKGGTDNSWFWDGYVENGTKYVFLDFAVVYEDNTQNPSSFPTDNTWFFHFDGCSATNPRVLGAITFVESEDYEIWKVTVTDGTSFDYSSASSFTSNYNDDTETTVWDESMGGEPQIESLEYTANRSGKLVRVYVRAKVTEDSLTVHYIDQTANTEFYNYNIAVAKGTFFDEDFKLGTEKNTLINNSVTNIKGVKQVVTADLSSMTEIGAQYRYSDYQCVQVVRSENGKEIFLYYTFNNAHEFVIDFGLPVNISIDNLNITGDWTNVEVSGAKYGTVTASKEDGITYTPNKVLEGVEILQLTLTGDTGSVTHQIYIYPATTVYYEEGFASLTGFTGGSKGNGTQATDRVGSSGNYGKDAKYENEAVGASNSSQAVSNTTGDIAEFSFVGTGVDIYANCTDSTGRVMIQIKSNGSTVKLLQVNTIMANGSDAVTSGEVSPAYNIPIASVDLENYAEYTVKITHTKTSTGTDSGIVYFDGFKVYNTLGTNANANNIYKQDNEADPIFVELRDSVLQVALDAEYTDSDQYAEQIAQNVMNQVYALYEDGINALVLSQSLTGATDATVTDLIDNGPKNEIYLKPKDTIVFSTNATGVQIGLKALNKATSYSINYEGASESQNMQISTSTDMFYEIKSGTTTITNTGDGILSITDLKLFNPSEASGIATVSEEVVTYGLLRMGYASSEPEVTYADASLTVAVLDETNTVIASTELTANGVSGETHVFTAEEIEAAVADLTLPENYVLDEAAYADVTIVYGESGTVTFTSSEKVIETEPETEPETKPEENPDTNETVTQIVNIVNKIFSSFRNFLNSIFGR